jgi:hypothetical protein
MTDMLNFVLRHKRIMRELEEIKSRIEAVAPVKK